MMTPCPECGSENIYRYVKPIAPAGGYGPDLLPKLNPSILSSAKVWAVLCGDCGLVRYFATDETRRQAGKQARWVRVSSSARP